MIDDAVNFYNTFDLDAHYIQIIELKQNDGVGFES